MYEQFTKEQLAEQADKARHVAIDLASAIYEYIAGDITKEDLQATVKCYLMPDIEQLLYHKIILKDFIDINTVTSDISIDDSDIEELVIKGE